MFLSDPSKERSDKTRMIYENAIAVSGEVVGLDTPLRSIDREGCRRLLDMLRWLPSNPTKRFPKLTAVQASEMAKAKKLRDYSSYYLGMAENYACLRGDRGPSERALIHLFRRLWEERHYLLATRVAWLILWSEG